MSAGSRNYNAPTLIVEPPKVYRYTRSQLLALRNASNLEAGCHYVITDYNRGTVGIAEIQLHAVEPNELSMLASINTAFDNISWVGRYDIDGNRVHALEDNIGNVVTGDTAVDGFPWGVTAVTENRVHEGVVNYTAGTLTETEIDGATLTISGGFVSRVAIKQSGSLTISGGALSESTIENDSDVTIIGGTNYENTFVGSSVYRQVGTGYIRYSSIEGDGTVTNGNVNINRSTFKSASAVNTTGSTGAISNSTFGYVNATNLQNIPNITLQESEFSGGSQISATGATRLYLSRSSASSGGRFLCSANAQLSCSYSSADNYGYIQTTLGALLCNYSKASSLGYISHQSSGTNRVDRSEAQTQANIRFLNSATGCRVFYCSADTGSSIYISGTSSACYIYYNSASSLSQIYIQNGANARFYYNSADSYSYIRAYGTNIGQSIMYYCKASARGYLEHLNITARQRFYAVAAEGQSIARQTGGATAANLYYSTFHAYYYFRGTLSGVTRSGLHGYGRQTFIGQPATNGVAVRNW